MLLSSIVLSFDRVFSLVFFISSFLFSLSFFFSSSVSRFEQEQQLSVGKTNVQPPVTERISLIRTRTRGVFHQEIRCSATLNAVLSRTARIGCFAYFNFALAPRRGDRPQSRLLLRIPSSFAFIGAIVKFQISRGNFLHSDSSSNLVETIRLQLNDKTSPPSTIVCFPQQ